jgi:squalene-hopene/tetraprenyl-beta-curcumene cyclase
VRWCRAMRSRNGAWGAFDKDNTRALVYRLPFADFGAMLDPPTEDVTAHVIELFAAVGDRPDHPDNAPALAYLRREQRPWGSWYGRWGVNHIYGTWCVVSALVALHTGHDMVRDAAHWISSVQNPDGGWGETCHSYKDESFAGVGTSTASQTAWAMLTLQLAGLGDDPACARGRAFLVERTRAPDSRAISTSTTTSTGTSFRPSRWRAVSRRRHFKRTSACSSPRHKQRPGERSTPWQCHCDKR